MKNGSDWGMSAYSSDIIAIENLIGANKTEFKDFAAEARRSWKLY